MFMEKLYRRMILLVAGLGCLACSEQETPVYEGLDYVNLESKQVSLSFDLLPVEDTLLTFNVKVMGYLAENEREVQVVATEGTTAQEGTDFRMEKCTIPANEIAGDCFYSRTDKFCYLLHNNKLLPAFQKHIKYVPKYLHILPWTLSRSDPGLLYSD